MHIHSFYGKFFSFNITNQSNITKNETYKTLGSHFVKQTIFICNEPYFSYQMNNMLVLPFSIILVIVFSFFSKRETGCIKNKRIGKSYLNEISKRPGIPSILNPFQRQNRFLVAALFCILANEIFKMIESTMFDSKEIISVGPLEETKLTHFISNTSLNSIGNNYFSDHSKKTDFLRIGLGLEPNILAQKIYIQTSTKIIATTSLLSSNIAKPVSILSPSILRYSKPRLPPKLVERDFETESTSTKVIDKILLYKILNQSYDPNDLNMTLAFGDKLTQIRDTKNKSYQIIQSFNQSLNGSSSKTLFEVSMSVYQNEYVQNMVNKVLSSQFKWSLITDKIKKLGFMMFEVLIIGLRYQILLLLNFYFYQFG